MNTVAHKVNDGEWPEAQVALMAEFYEATQEIEGSARRVYKGKVEIDLDYAVLGVDLGALETYETRQRHGVETLDFIKSLADKYNVSVFLDAEPLEGSPVSKPRLKKWYEENGFVRNGGSGMRYFPKSL